MTTIAHTISASYIAYLAFANTQLPLQLPLFLACVLPAALLDLDHLYFALKYPQHFKQWQRTGQLHKARSFFHEIPGIAILLGISLIASIFLPLHFVQAAFLSYSIHIIQDMIMGISKPLIGIHNTEMRLFNFTFKQKAIIDVVTILIFGGLWTLLLTKQLG